LDFRSSSLRQFPPASPSVFGMPTHGPMSQRRRKQRMEAEFNE